MPPHSKGYIHSSQTGIGPRRGRSEMIQRVVTSDNPEEGFKNVELYQVLS